MNTYDVGDMVRVRLSFVNSAGVGVDPSSLTLSSYIRGAPLTTVQTLVYGVNSIVRAGLGEYFSDVAANSAGTWQLRGVGTGDNQAAVQGQFDVRPINTQ